MTDQPPAQHLISLCFDDGFLASSLKTAEIFERFGVVANFNVVACGHRDDFVAPDPYQEGVPKGDFGVWRELRDRGHEIMPHGYRHIDKSKVPFAEAKDQVERCLEVFARELPGFRADASVYNLPYNAASDELAQWFPSAVRAYRVGGSGINPLPHTELVRLSSTVFGPRNGNEDHLPRVLDELLAKPEGWLIYLFHGLGDEGYGPVSEEYLESTLEQLLAIDSVRLVPPAAALAS